MRFVEFNNSIRIGFYSPPSFIAIIFLLFTHYFSTILATWGDQTLLRAIALFSAIPGAYCAIDIHSSSSSIAANNHINHPHPNRRDKRHYYSSSDGSSQQQGHSLVAYGTSKVMGDCVGREDETLCDPTQGGVCKNHTCLSACHVSSRYSPRLQPCVCASEDDSFCYLCCGSSNQACAPAHAYHIYKPNGEYWERQVCSRCRTYPNGVSCDERNAKRVCHNGKCVSSVCHGKAEGSFCTLDLSRLCVDDECRDPCKEHDPLLRICDCDIHSEDRCELCCHHGRTKRCENAYQKYKITNKDGRMILRVGLTCRRGLTCNKYGTCGGPKSARASDVLLAVLTTLLCVLSHMLRK